MYDWANSAYATTVAAAILPVYFERVVVGPDGFVIGESAYAAQTLWGLLVAASALFVFLAAPTLGAIADFASAKKRFLMGFAYFGVLNAALLFFCRAGDVWRTMGLFVLAHIGFVGANVFYDAFLPQIAPEGKQDWLSSKGFAFGYIGGGIQFALALVLVLVGPRLGISGELAARLGMLMAVLWWGGFALVTAFLLRESPATECLPERFRRRPFGLGYVAVGFARVWVTTRRVGNLRHLLLFLIAFMIYNDGIQTVIEMAAIYGAGELRLDTAAIMATLLVVQFVAFGGALLFGRLAGRIGTKRTVMLSLVGWSGVVTLAYFIHASWHFFVLGAVVGLVLGGSQSLSRSFYGSMIPEQASAEFFGFYSVFNKFSSIWGPLVFALIKHWTGSSRNAIFSLITFFVLGILLLAGVNEQKAREGSRALAA
jgi:UMF1 family MFS transporter